MATFLQSLCRQFKRDDAPSRTYEISVALSDVPKLAFAARRLKCSTSQLLRHMVAVGIDTVYQEVRR